MHQEKLKLCPGYDGGLSTCLMIYTFDRTRPQESSFTCEKEYHGDLTLDLCANHGDAKVQYEIAFFKTWVQIASHEVASKERSQLAQATGSPAPQSLTLPPAVTVTPSSVAQTVAPQSPAVTPSLTSAVVTSLSTDTSTSSVVPTSLSTDTLVRVVL
ncbi:hypothetical protein BU23DRAFT_594918 [Bimuria novae-zelandiae CBS 107.79]|uniref:Uncharacterized protein n=1 Tax=Bimuria novae-zelandiae CBS 107.79 TaxID=1447943 RepID=A0A6A5VXW7_9PLEO|nr:hypothetical protein BU23DRAFT_594918 [Bimuria novae-zelandiae CBS 107.79]